MTNFFLNRQRPVYCIERLSKGDRDAGGRQNYGQILPYTPKAGRTTLKRSRRTATLWPDIVLIATAGKTASNGQERNTMKAFDLNANGRQKPDSHSPGRQKPDRNCQVCQRPEGLTATILASVTVAFLVQCQEILMPKQSQQFYTS